MASMSRIAATGSHQNGQMNGLANLNDAPPSTLAANFANNLSTTRRPSRHDDQDDFQQLLLDVSKYEENPHGVTSVEERLEHCQELIYVVVIGVLEPLTKSNTSVNEQDQLQKASEGLDVLIATINEFPVVLDQVPGQRVQMLSGSDAPLWMWLFPQVLALVGSKRCETLKDKITDFFKASFTEVSKTLQLWALNSAFFGYLKHCANGKHFHVEIMKIS
jgi:serine/threonine-protein kinase ATR